VTQEILEEAPFVCPRRGCSAVAEVEVTRGALTLKMCPPDAEAIVRDDWKGWVVNRDAPPMSGGVPVLEVYRKEGQWQ
jgi:hypothetical protein